MAVTSAKLDISAERYVPHDLHDQHRVWVEKNCYLDVWIELLHCLRLNPLAGAAFTLGADFEGDQWSFSKYPPEDLRRLYGLQVAELNVWRPVLHHVLEHLELGRLLTVEVDSYFLPDTEGIAYRLAHTKTTVIPQMVDAERRTMEYFHNAGYFCLTGDDFDGVLGLGVHAQPDLMPPYVELVKLEGVHRTPDGLLAVQADELMAEYLERRPPGNPVARWAARVSDDVDWLATAGSDQFHPYAFAMCRQFGAAAELAGAMTAWLADQGRPEPAALRTAAAHLQECAHAAKSLQFALARLARGRKVDVTSLLDKMVGDWDTAVSALVARSALV